MVSGFKKYLEDKASVGFLVFEGFNPPTVEHQKLLDRVSSVAENNAYKVFASPIIESTDNPLNYLSKVKFMRKVFPRHARNIILDNSITNVLEAAHYMFIQGGYKNLAVVSATPTATKELLEKFNGIEGEHGYFNFHSIKCLFDRPLQISETVSLSESVQLQNVRDNDFASFSLNLPKSTPDNLAKELFNATRKGMDLDENKTFTRHVILEPVSERREDYINGNLFHAGQSVILKESDEVVTIAHLGSNYVIVEMDGKKKRKWLTDVEPLEEKVSQSQINDLERFADKLLAKYKIDIEFTKHFVDRVNDARNNPEIKIAELQKFFKKIHKAKGNKIKSVGDMQAVLKDVEKDLNIPAVLQDKGDDFEVRFKTIMRKKNFKTPNKVITYEQKEVAQDPDIKDKKGTQPKKYYADLSKSTKSARDSHFKKGAAMDDDNPDAYKPAPGDKDAETKPSKHTKRFKQMFGEEEKKGLAAKAEKSGMPLSILKQVYNRGMAAWRTGHRPGTTPQQWAMARVNSFVTKSSGTWGGADKDLAAKVKK